MRIVHLVGGGDVAGGQLVALRLAHGARAAGHEALFVSPTPGAFVDRVRAEGFAVRVVQLDGALSVPSLVRLARVLRAERADVVHTHTHFSLGVLGRVAARLAGARTLAHMHIENAFRAGFGRGAQVALDNLSARLCTWIVAVSEATRASLVAQGYPAGRLVTVRNGIDADRAEPRRPPEVPAGAPLVGEVARLAEVKGQRELIRAVAQLDGVWCVLAGADLEAGGAFQRELEREADALGVRERILFTGYLAEVAGLLAALDVFVLPSTAEGLPLTVLEAMAQARPVVASAVGGTPEAVHDGETGLLVPPGDVDALVVALRSLLEDPERARRLGEAGRERVEQEFSAAAASAQVVGLYTAPA